MVGCRPAAAALLLLLVLGPAPHAVAASAASRTAGTHDGADNTSTNSNNNKYSSVTAAVYSDQSCSGTPTEVQKYPIGVCFVNAVSTKILNCSDDGSSFLEGAYHDANCTDADSAPYRTNTSTCLREGNNGVRWLCNLGAAGGGAWAEAELGATVDADATASARRPGPASQEGARRHHPHGGGDTEGTGAPVESEKRSAAPEAPRTEIGGGELRYAAPVESEKRSAELRTIGNYTTLQLREGRIRGTTTHSGRVRRFLGVPYAEPPVGERRWRPPTPKANWTGTRAAWTYSASCVQGEQVKAGVLVHV